MHQSIPVMCQPGGIKYLGMFPSRLTSLVTLYLSERTAGLIDIVNHLCCSNLLLEPLQEEEREDVLLTPGAVAWSFD